MPLRQGSPSSWVEFRNWRVWHLLGLNELRHRYARSRFGQFWLVLSTAAMIGVIAGVWSLLWNQSVRDLMPFFGISIIMWNFMSQVLIECTVGLLTHGNLYRNQKMNFSVSVYSVIYKNTMMLAHNLIIIAILIIGFGVPVNWYLLQIVPAFVLTWIMMVWLGYVLAMACVRYRDMIQVISNWMMVFSSSPRSCGSRIFFRPIPFHHRLQSVCAVSGIAAQPVSGAAGERPCLAHHGRDRAWRWRCLSLPVIGRYQRRIIFWM